MQMHINPAFSYNIAIYLNVGTLIILLQVSTFFTHSNVGKKLYKNRLRNV
jgi:hypothetical protein